MWFQMWKPVRLELQDRSCNSARHCRSDDETSVAHLDDLKLILKLERTNLRPDLVIGLSFLTHNLEKAQATCCRRRPYFIGLTSHAEIYQITGRMEKLGQKTLYTHGIWDGRKECATTNQYNIRSNRNILGHSILVCDIASSRRLYPLMSRTRAFVTLFIVWYRLIQSEIHTQ